MAVIAAMRMLASKNQKKFLHLRIRYRFNGFAKEGTRSLKKGVMLRITRPIHKRNCIPWKTGDMILSLLGCPDENIL